MDASPPPPSTPTPHLTQLSHLLQGHPSSPLLASSPTPPPPPPSTPPPHPISYELPYLPRSPPAIQSGGAAWFTCVNISSRKSSFSSSLPSTSPPGSPTHTSVSYLVNGSPQITPSNSRKSAAPTRIQYNKKDSLPPPSPPPSPPPPATKFTRFKSPMINVMPPPLPPPQPPAIASRIQYSEETVLSSPSSLPPAAPMFTRNPYTYPPAGPDSFAAHQFVDVQDIISVIRISPVEHEHTNCIPKRVRNKDTLHTGVDNREENKPFDDVDGAMFCRISLQLDAYSADPGMPYHHTETTDSIESESNTAPDTVQDTECIQRNSTFFVELKTGDSRGFDDVDTHWQYEQGDGVGMQNIIGSTIGNGSGVRLVQPEIDACLIGESLTSDGISNTYTARGIGSRINYSMSDMHHMNNNNKMLHNLAGRSCNDIIVANIESSVSYPRLNSSTTLSSVHRKLPNQLLIRDCLRSSQSERMNSTTSSQSCRSGIDSCCIVTLGSAIERSYGPLKSDSCNDSSSHLGEENHQNELELEHAGNVPHEYSISDTTDNNELSQWSSSLGDTDVNDITADVQCPEVRESQNSCMDQADKQQPASKCKTFKAYAAAALAAVSTVLFFVDICTDVWLAWMYHYDGDYTMLYVTLAFIIVPSILMGIIDISWIFLDRKSSSNQDDNLVWFAARVVFGLFSFGRAIRACSFIRHHLKSLRKAEKDEWHRKRALEEKRDCHMLDFINAFAECAPQLLFQLYLMCKFSLDLFVHQRFVSLLFSWLCIAWTYASYYKCHRKALPNKYDVTTLGFAVVLLSCLSSLSVRFICFALFMTYFDFWIPGVLLGSHIVLMFIIITYQKPSFKGMATSKLGRILYSVFFAYVSLFSFVNLREDRSRVRMTVFYVLFYVENVMMAALVVWRLGFVEYQTVDSQAHRQLCLIMVPVCSILHIALLSLYYSVLHPTIGRLRKQWRR